MQCCPKTASSATIRLFSLVCINNRLLREPVPHTQRKVGVDSSIPALIPKECGSISITEPCIARFLDFASSGYLRGQCTIESSA